MTPEEKRSAVAAKYRTIIGRNIYSQNLRSYCYKKYSNGKYYSDCSSSICLTYSECGLGFGLLNTVGMYKSSKLQDVPVIIKNGQIQNPEVLRVGDMLLYAGNDSSRGSAVQYVGHTELIGEVIPKTGGGVTVWLYGHGSGNPKRHEMVAYNKSRYNTKASTPLGHRGLIKVRRFIIGTGDDSPTFKILSYGSTGADVTEMQEALMSLGYELPEYGADGEFGKETEIALKKFQQDRNLTPNGIYTADTDVALHAAVTALEAKHVRITGISVNVRKTPDVSGQLMGIAHRDDLLPYGGEQTGTWFRVTYKDNPDCWISSKYSEVIK